MRSYISRDVNKTYPYTFGTFIFHILSTDILQYFLLDSQHRDIQHIIHNRINTTHLPQFNHVNYFLYFIHLLNFYRPQLTLASNSRAHIPIRQSHPNTAMTSAPSPEFPK